MGVFQEAWRPFQLCRLQPVYKSCTISRYCIKNFSLQKIGETLASIVPVFKKVYPWCQNCTLYLFWSLLWPYRSSNNEGHTIKLWRVCPMRGWVMREWFLSITKFGNLPSKQMAFLHLIHSYQGDCFLGGYPSRGSIYGGDKNWKKGVFAAQKAPRKIFEHFFRNWKFWAFFSKFFGNLFMKMQ